ncbi:MAG TPA: cytochrome P450 [Acidimicrobiales bacterium]|nr:cytochrome P450 [Acidimicrobiales bacterium]
MATSVHTLELPEVDIFGLEREEAVAAFERARDQHWLCRIPLGYAITRYEDAVAVLRDRRFHSALSVLPQMAGVADEELSGRQQRSILAMEGPEHARLRRLAAPAFTPKAADRLRPFMREVVAGLVDEVVDQGRCELVADICEPYPIPIICELLGAPKEDWKLFSSWATDIFRIFNNDLPNDLPRIKAAFAELDTYVRAMIDERRSRPADDLLSEMIAAEEAGDRLSTDELVMMTEAVLMAGTDTTRNQLACSVALLAEHPDQWRLLGDDPSLAAPAVEETMRYLGAVRGTARIAAEDVDVRDVEFPQGTFVVISLATANRDPEKWPDPHGFDIRREPSPTASTQLTFGSGIHFCLGAALARAELQEALPLLARRMQDLALDGPVVWKPPDVGIWGPAVLSLRFAPAAG